MITRQQRWGRLGPLSVATAAALAFAACESDRATILQPAGDPSYNANLANVQRNTPDGEFAAVKPRSAAGTASFFVTLRGLDSLAGSAVYQIWLGKQNGATVTDFVKANAAILAERVDTTFTPEGDPEVNPNETLDVTASSFNRGGPSTTVSIEVNATTFGSDPRAKDVLLITVEDNANATQPGDIRPFWSRTAGASLGLTAAESTLVNDVSFGNFDPDPSKEYIYTPVARGTASFRGNVFVTDDSGLARPPKGYYYETYLITRERVPAGTGTGTNARTKDTLKVRSVGALTAPFPRRATSLRDADITLVDPVVLADPPVILAAASRLGADTANLVAGQPYAVFNEIRMTLESKKGSPDRMAPTVVLLGAVPDVVRQSASTQ
ncbi:MAG TPA: hypothetical protein VKA84_14850 [Gemmatimonadaceae bacterium]|nr:hypothetical protein [Gemmatimonadaceae bacterium]